MAGVILQAIERLFVAARCLPVEIRGRLGVIWIIFSVLELLTELRYYAAEAGADPVTSGEDTIDTNLADRDPIESVIQAPSV